MTASPNQNLPSGLSARTAKRVLTERFKRAGFAFAGEDALELVMAATGLSQSDIALNGDSILAAKISETLQVYALRRLSGEPVDMILGWREFFGRRFKVTKEVLSPRSDTENLIRCGLKAIDSLSTPKILDLGTGSGAILVTLLAERLDATGVGVDISDKALAIAQYNAAQLAVADRAQFIKSTWFENISDTFDLIISNPPYITDEAMTRLERDVVDYDPDISLRGGEDGLSAYRAILSQARNHLCVGGYLWVEIGYDQACAVQTLFKDHGFSSIKLVKDLSGQNRCVGGKAES